MSKRTWEKAFTNIWDEPTKKECKSNCCGASILEESIDMCSACFEHCEVEYEDEEED